MKKRPYGTTGIELSFIGFGGIALNQTAGADANRYVAEAIDYGVDYFDVAPSYGNSEDRLGPALRPYRDLVFLACKTQQRTKQGAAQELRQSLQKLQTDHFDLYQLHAMESEEDYEIALGPQGALEAIVEAQAQGLIRYIGFSAHSTEIALKLIEAFSFQSVLMPINFVAWLNGGFGLEVIPKAKEKGMAVLAIKAMAKQLVPEGQPPPNERCWYEPLDNPKIMELALRWTLSQDVTAAIPPGDMKLFRQAIAFVDNYCPITEDEEQTLREYAEGKTPIFRKKGLTSA